MPSSSSSVDIATTAARADGIVRIERTPFGPAIAQCSAFVAMLDVVAGNPGATTGSGAPPAATIGVEQLTRLIDEATRRAPRRPRRAAAAGVTHVRAPGALVGPARVVVWWGFTRAPEAAVQGVTWSAAERAQLAAAGVALEDAGTRARTSAERAARPLLCAQDALVLASPRVDRAGQRTHAHPLWDEIVGRAGGDPRTVSSLVVTRLRAPLAPARVAVAPVALPHPMERFAIHGAVQRTLESPSSMELLIGCPLKFVLDTWRVKHPRELALEKPAQMFGNVAHDVFATVLRDLPATAADAESRARAAFVDVVKERADFYALPQNALVRRADEETIARAVGTLVGRLREEKRDVRGVELKLEMPPRDGRTMTGTVDLVVGDPTLIIDLKTGSERFYADKVQLGTAIQLAYYAYLWVKRARPEGEPEPPWPAVAYYHVRSNRTFADPHPEATMHKARIRARAAFDEIEKGSARAPGAVREPDDMPDDEIRPPCRFCDRDVICGRAIRRAERR
jgi:hypothetical protein